MKIATLTKYRLIKAAAIDFNSVIPQSSNPILKNWTEGKPTPAPEVVNGYMSELSKLKAPNINVPAVRDVPIPTVNKESTMEEFAKSFLPGLFKREGKQNTDQGGFTRYGISQKAYPKLNLHNLTQQGAENIYRDDYIKPIWNRISKFNPDVQKHLADAKINGGYDNILSDLNENSTAADVIKRRTQYYQSLAKQDPKKYGPSLPGWLNRLKNI